MSDHGRPNRSVARLAVAGAGLVVAAAACLESSIVQVGVEDVVEVRLTPDSAHVAVARTLQAQALTLDRSRRLLVGVEVGWSTVDSGVATVDESGLVTGVAPGTTRVVASAGGLADTATVVVQEPPVLVLSDDTVAFATQAGGAEPAPDTVQVTNGGVFPLTGLAVDSIAYGSATEGWLTAQLGATAAPSEIELVATASGITAAGTYRATVWVSATDADGSPATIEVALEVAAGAAASIALNDGDGQTVEVGTEVAVPPSVLVLDAFDNPVPGVEVTFTVTGGGGSVVGSPATTDASGIAAVGSWTLGGPAGANSLDATLAGVGTVGFTATGVPGAPTRLEIVAGDGQSAVAGSPVSTQPSVVALDVFDNGVEGVDVVFAVTSGDGLLSGSAQATDVTGAATLGSWTLGTTAGTNTVEATAASIPDSVTFTATGLPGDIDQIVMVAGDAQTDTVAATLATPYSVRVEDVNDNGIPGVTVSWQVTGGGGTITGTSDTDAGGSAVAARVLGTTAGTQTALATIGGVADTVTFTATAIPGTPSQISAVAGTGQSATVATALAEAPSVLVTDGFGNPIAGHSVTFAASAGSISPTGAMTTAADGTATLTSWTLGTIAATISDTLEVTAAGPEVAPSPLVITATATAGAPASIAVEAGDAQTAVTGSAVATPPTVRVEDQYGNVVPDVRVDFSPTAGSSVGAAADTTGSTGLATTIWTLTTAGPALQDDGTYPHTLTATVNGTVLTTTFAGDAVYGFDQDVNPILEGCAGCHSSGFGGLTLDGTTMTPLQHYQQLVGISSTCDPGVLRVSAAGGVTAEEDLSLLTIYLNAGLLNPASCTGHGGGTRTGTTLEILQAWVRNGAPFN